jgi:hypothetical protein
MNNRKIEISLNIASLAAFVSVVTMSIPLFERFIAAAWQWYKFAGLSNDGHITLSPSTGMIYSALLAAVFVCSFLINRFAKRLSAKRAMTWSLWTMYVAIGIAIGYWLLGLSFLNKWRA